MEQMQGEKVPGKVLPVVSRSHHDPAAYQGLCTIYAHYCLHFQNVSRLAECELCLEPNHTSTELVKIFSLEKDVSLLDIHA